MYLPLHSLILTLLLLVLPSTLSIDSGYEVGPPHVMFLGVAKGGTTALWFYLIRSAGLCGGTTKEYHYWGMHHSREKLPHYFREFASCPPGSITLDGSPSNGAANAVENMIRSYSEEELRSKKFIYVLREPLDRMLSWFNFERDLAAEPCVDIMSELPNCDIFTSQAGHLDSFRDYYDHHYTPAKYVRNLELIIDSGKGTSLTGLPRKQVFIVSFDTLKVNTSDTLKRISAFLNVNASNYELPHVNEGSEHSQKDNIEPLPMKCSDYRHYRPLFQTLNAGLIDMINNHPDKPPEEPYFPEFADKFADKCSGPRTDDEEDY